MNARLSSENESRSRQRARQRRKDQQKARRRRTLALAALHHPCLAASETALTAQESCGWLWGDDLRMVKRAIRRLNAAAEASAPRPAMVSTLAAPDRIVARPVRLLRKASRGEVPLLRLPPVTSPAEFLGLERTLLAARELARRGSGAPQILQFMACPMACGLSRQTCAELAYTVGVLRSPSDADLLDTMNRAIAFQNLLADGHSMYRAMVAVGELAAIAGAWAFFSKERLGELLPGLRLPLRLQRDEYLVNVIAGADSNPVCLDLHGLRYRPICRHPLR